MKTIYIATYAQNTIMAGQLCNKYTQEDLESQYETGEMQGHDCACDGDIIIHAGTRGELQKGANDVILTQGKGPNAAHRVSVARSVLEWLENN